MLRQIEQCGWAAHLAETHREIAEDKHGARPVKQEIARAWAVRGQAELVDADAAVRWLMSEPGQVEQVGGHMDMVDTESGEVLASGNVDAIIDTTDGKVLVVSWVVGEHYDMPEPEEDVGLVAMGLAACNGKPFKVAHVYLMDGEAFPRRSPVFPPEAHPALWKRIRAAVSAPRIPCPGSWCGHCRQAQFCESWLARARTSLATMRDAMVMNDEGKIEKAEGFELTDDNAGSFYEALEYAKKAREFGYELVKSHARKGGKVMHDGKMLVLSDRNGRVTVTTSEFKEILKRIRAAAKADQPHVDLDVLADELESTIKTGDPCEYPLWKDPKAIGGRR